MKNLKMYILIKSWIDSGHAINSAAHAGAMIRDRWDEFDPIMKEWYDTSFRKCTCKVTEKQFEKSKTYFSDEDWFVVTEMAFDHKEVAIVFKPRKEWPKFFQFLPLWK